MGTAFHEVGKQAMIAFASLRKVARVFDQRRYLTVAVLVLAAMLFNSAAADSWVVREIASTSDGHLPAAYRHVDVMVRPDGTPVVGYVDRTNGSTPTLSFIEGVPVRYVTSPLQTDTASFAMDGYGIASYAGFSSPTYGTDAGSGQVIDANDRPELMPSLGQRLGSLALNPQGIPTIVSRLVDYPSDYHIGSFDMISASWQVRTISSSVPWSAGDGQPAGEFTYDGRLVIGSASESAGQFEVAIEQADDTYFRVSGASWGPSPTLSIATSDDGEVAFAFRQAAGLMVGLFNEGHVTYETIAPATGGMQSLAPGSLAYAPDGTLSIAFTEELTGSGGQVVFAQRTATNDWNRQTLDAQGVLASLAFDASGNPYVGVASSEGIALLSPALLPLIKGDMSGDGQLDFDDINPFLLALNDPSGYESQYGLDPNVAGDINGDGQLDFDDINPFVALLSGNGSANLVPEPATLSLIALGGLMTLTRRRQKSIVQV